MAVSQSLCAHLALYEFRSGSLAELHLAKWAMDTSIARQW